MHDGDSHHKPGWYTPLVYAATVFVSAFLLFQVQPLLSKFILPWFGGTPAVWTSAMLFFQIVLFLGYLYAHVTSTYLSARQRLYLHWLVLAAALGSVALNRLIPPTNLRPTGGNTQSPLLQVLLLLGATVGLPYFALSSTGPLLQKWYSETFSRSPYRLFALSNLGSLLALLSYPFIFEANWGIVSQALMWSVGFAVFVVCCAYCAWQTYTQSTHRSPKISSVSDTSATSSQTELSGPHADGILDSPPTSAQVFWWIALPTLACVLFLAITNEVCQNIATVPLLWIVPLALYLLSFIVAFDQPKWYSRRIYAIVTLGLILLVSNYTKFAESLSSLCNRVFGLSGPNRWMLSNLWSLEAGVYFLTLLCMLVVCHGELAKSKPTPRYLTRFYLTLSLGGALGGVLVNLIAPNVFTRFFELPLGLFCCALLCVGLLIRSRKGPWNALQVAILALGGLLLTGICWYLVLDARPDRPTSNHAVLHRSRNFYGVLSVQRYGGTSLGEINVLLNGHIQHGMQPTDPSKRRTPTSYYGTGSGCETAILFAQQQSEQCHIGAIGLGVGTIAAYARAHDKVRFYEINPQVIEVAKNTDWFHYLSDCPGQVDLVLGDARLQLEQELTDGQSQQFDVLILDAFSGDAIPTHLLTDQSFTVYSKHLKSEGVLAIHITNTHLDLFPVVRQLAEKHGYSYRRIYRKGTDSLSTNYYALLCKAPKFAEQVADAIDDLPLFLSRPRSVPLWTDEYTNLTRLLR